MSQIEARLADLGVTLPDAPAPAANYVPFVKVGSIVHVSGQISAEADGMILGKLGESMEIEAGAAAARQCAISLLAQVKAACDGDIERLVRVIKLTGFVNSTQDFTDQPKVGQAYTCRPHAEGYERSRRESHLLAPRDDRCHDSSGNCQSRADANDADHEGRIKPGGPRARTWEQRPARSQRAAPGSAQCIRPSSRRCRS